MYTKYWLKKGRIKEKYECKMKSIRFQSLNVASTKVNTKKLKEK